MRRRTRTGQFGIIDTTPWASDAFWAQVDKSGECWLWTGARGGPYGKFSYGSRTLGTRIQIGAHRFAYQNLVGPIPDGLVLDHLCRTPLCVRPDHLEAVTQWENTLRTGNPIAELARKTHCKRDHELSGENLAIDPKTGQRRCRACSRIWAAEARRRRAAA
jgi:hypothetical protein